MGSSRREEPQALAAGWERASNGYRGVLRRRPLSGARPVTVRWRCDHEHDNFEAAESCACIEKDERYRSRERENASYERGPLEEAKRCRKCEKLKPLAEFTRDSSKPDGYRNECRDCKHVGARAYRAANREAVNAKVAQWRKDDPARALVSAKRSVDRLRDKVLDHYGHSCACCGSGERLHVDHVNGDGAAHREELFGDPTAGGGGSFYRWLITNGFPEGFQTLCERCNRSKGNGAHCMLDHALGLPAGVSYRPGVSRSSPWQARIGKRYLGVFGTREEAIVARREAERLGEERCAS